MSEQLIYRGETRNNVEQKPLGELKLELDQARSHWAKISAKRQNRLFDRRIHGYNEAQQNYNALLAEYGRRSLADKIGGVQNARERNVIALNYIVDMQNQLRTETDKISDSKRMRKFGRAIGKWLTTGSKVTQFAKGAAVSMVAGAAGGLVGASVATLAAMRFAKGYLTSEVSGLGEVEANTYHDEFAQDEDHETLFQRAQAKSAETFEQLGGDQQAKKRAAVRRGVGVMAVGFVVGGTIGSLIHGAIDAVPAHATPLVSDVYDNPGLEANADYVSPGVQESVYQSTGLEAATPSLAVEHINPGLSDAYTTYDSPQLAGTYYENPGLGDAPVNSESLHLVGNAEYSSPGLNVAGYTNPGLDTGAQTTIGIGGVYENPGLVDQPQYENPGLLNVESPSESIDVSAFTVQQGHGYVNEIMDSARANDIKITPEQAWGIHKDIVNKVGTDYINLLHHGGPDTYSMGDSKYETGISASGEAEWDPQAADILRDKFAELQADDVVASSDHEDMDAMVTHEFSGDAQHISNGEGFYQTESEMGIPASGQTEVLQEAAPQLYDQGIAYEMNDSLPGINMTSDHVMPQESLETLHQAAIDTNVGDDLTVTHEEIVFDEATDAASTTTADNGEFLVSDFGKSYDVDAQSYYDALSRVDRSHWQALLNEAAPKLQSVTYDGESITYRDAAGWHFREVDELPPSANKILTTIANKHNWTLAA